MPQLHKGSLQEYCLQSLREMKVSYQLVFIPEPMKIKYLVKNIQNLEKLNLKLKKEKKRENELKQIQ